jgi:hypothetical protein
MDRLRSCMEVLRLLSRQPDSGNRLCLAEKQMNEYLQQEVAALKAALVGLGKAIDEEAKQGGDWSMMRTYVREFLAELPGESVDSRKTKPAACAMVVQRIGASIPKRGRMAAYQFPSGHMCRPRSIVTLLCFALAGCASAVQQRSERMHTSLTPYIGRTVADYALDHGPPTNTVDLGPSKKGFQWLTTKSCTVSIVAHATKPNPELSDWVIEHWRWQGVC